MKQSRWRSPVAWGSFATLVLFIAENFGLLGHIGLTAQGFSELVSLVFAVLIAFGIFNNPTDKKGF